MPNPLPHNAHIHLPPNFSAFETVAEAVEQADQEGLGLLGVSNYYDFDVYADFANLARKKGIFPLFGLEIICLIDELVKAGLKINDPGNPGKMYLCGKGLTRFAPLGPEAQRLMNVIRKNDSERMAAMVDKLADIFAQRGADTGLTASAVMDRVMRRHNCPRERVYLQERHVCQAFQEVLFDKIPVAEHATRLPALLGLAPAPNPQPPAPVAFQNDLRSHLMKAGKPGYVPETFVGFEHAYRLILELGGIPCYPVLADGAKPICPFEESPEKLIENLQNRNIHAAEFIPLRNTPETLLRYVPAMRKAGLALTAGTEHNTLDKLPLVPTGLKGAAIPVQVQEIFWEGACVVAAHQFLTQRGECGYVDAAGLPNPAYATADERITNLARLGAQVMERDRKS